MQPQIIIYSHLDETGIDWDQTIFGPFISFSQAESFAARNLSATHAYFRIVPLHAPKTIDKDFA